MSSPHFDDVFQRRMPSDPVDENRSRQVENAAYSRVKPRNFAHPSLLAYSRPLAQSFGFSEEFCHSDEFLRGFSGSDLLPGMKPYAMCYGGHQFGHWAGQLGDGRAINLGELRDQQGLPHVFQLKGAGPTPYSRSADGFAVLRSSIREFLCSEAMHELGIPTTRALCLIASGERVERDMFYNGNPQFEPGAIVTRVAPSFIRFGSFEIFAARGELDNLQALFSYTIEQHYPHLKSVLEKDVPQAVLAFLSELSRRSADLIVEWMRVGFVHGVMNTDNMSIIAQTIDYGPYGWLDNFDPHWTPNTTDAQHRRYRYENQAAVTQWNLLQLANALYPLVNSATELETIIREFSTYYERAWRAMMAGKLGLSGLAAQDQDFVSSLEKNLYESQLDMTLFYRELASCTEQDFDPQTLNTLSYSSALTVEQVQSWRHWFEVYRQKLDLSELESSQRVALMNRSNPTFILRNWITQVAIDKAYEGDYSELRNLLEAIRHPYDQHQSQAAYLGKRPQWAAQKAGCSMLSCSS